MASPGREQLPQAQSVSGNPFSIKNILNLSEEPQDKSAQVSIQKSHPTFPVVPQAIRPPVALYNMETGLASFSTTQWLCAASHFPPWLLGTRFMRFLPGATPFLQRRRNQRKRKQRPLFTQKQVRTMELEFARHRYVSEEKRAELASNLNLTETQVKTWFQNRRTKWRKEARDELETVLMDSKRRSKEDTKADESFPSSSSTTSLSITSQGCTQLFIDLDNYKLKPT